jgi:hypothetical protein
MFSDSTETGAMSSQASRPAASAKSPILAAVGISLIIGIGALLGTADPATLSDVFTGRLLTRPFTETQQGHTVAIAALEQGLGNVTREIDFVTTRMGAAIERNENRAADRLAQLDTEIAALKTRLAGLQGVKGAPVASEATDIIGLRSSLHDLAAAHSSAVAALTKRLDRIEVKVGLSSDVVATNPPARKKHRVVARVRKPPVPPAFESEAMPATARPDRGHLFNVKPLSHQAAPLRLTRLPTSW